MAPGDVYRYAPHGVSCNSEVFNGTFQFHATMVERVFPSEKETTTRPVNDSLGELGARKGHGHRLDVAAASPVGRVSHGYCPLQPVTFPAGGATRVAHYQGFLPSIHLFARNEEREQTAGLFKTKKPRLQQKLSGKREAFNMVLAFMPGPVHQSRLGLYRSTPGTSRVTSSAFLM